jgi:hypothetical protein
MHIHPCSNSVEEVWLQAGKEIFENGFFGVSAPSKPLAGSTGGGRLEVSPGPASLEAAHHNVSTAPL